jgi:OmpA-OmpF porin, OOP family
MKNFLLFTALLIPSIASSQTPEPNEKEAIAKITITDFKKQPRAGEVILFEAQKTKKVYEITSGKNGTCALLLPKNDTYKVKYKSFINQKEYSSFSIPGDEGKLTIEVILQMDEEEKTFTLENVFFDTGKATLRPESFKALNELVEAMKAKPTLVIEIGGHTDNVGTPESNLTLSQGRADAVKNYLVKNKIASGRVLSKGYGDTLPVAYNDTEKGRQQNRRTEVKIIKE